MRHLLSFLGLVFCAVILFAACNSTEKRNGTPAASGPPTIAADGIRRVTVAELRDMVARNEAFIVDVRSEDSYKAGHIQGAKLIPTADIVNRSNELPKDKIIVTYCA